MCIEVKPRLNVLLAEGNGEGSVPGFGFAERLIRLALQQFAAPNRVCRYENIHTVCIAADADALRWSAGR